MNIIEKIDRIRVQKGWSFYKLAQESGLTQQTFTKWISGKSVPTVPALEAICEAFDSFEPLYLSVSLILYLFLFDIFITQMRVYHK